MYKLIGYGKAEFCDWGCYGAFEFSFRGRCFGPADIVRRPTMKNARIALQIWAKRAVWSRRRR